MLVADLIRDAIAQIGTRGWTQNEFTDEPGRVCIYTAVSLSSPTTPGFVSAFRCIALAVNDDHFFAWNDALGRTQEQVLAVLKIAARLPEAQREI